MIFLRILATKKDLLALKNILKTPFSVLKATLNVYLKQIKEIKAPKNTLISYKNPIKYLLNDFQKPCCRLHAPY
jgi:hypothetical protein